MIYLIGGPPKCGKTTLAKQLAKKLGIQWVATDTLEVIGRDRHVFDLRNHGRQ